MKERLAQLRRWFGRLDNRGKRDRRLGDAARARREWAGAIAHYRRYLKIRPESFAIWVQLGHAYKEAGQPSDALGAYVTALGLDGNDPDLLLNLGHLHKRMGRRDLAIQYYRRSVTLNGNLDAQRELIRMNAWGSRVRFASGPPVRRGPDKGQAPGAEEGLS